ncbi:MAG: sarcosine oxidase subunit delta [Xanthobacteraceae bacterium]|nr:sarcosine oxidase subunit delta [Xanthobacteraceae bacterium]
MRLLCPHCGERDRQEFTVLGDAAPVRPHGLDTSADAMLAYLYPRENVRGPVREFWYHGAGCHAWLIVERDTRTHAVFKVKPAREVVLARQEGL